MKPASLFFLCFSFLLLSGSTRQYLLVSFQSSYSLISSSLKNGQQAQPGSQSKSNYVLSADAGGTGYDYLNAIEPEDTDDEDSRFPEWSNCFFEPGYHQAFGNLQGYHKDRLPACLHFALLASEKYLTYRVIRI